MIMLCDYVIENVQNTK